MQIFLPVLYKKDESLREIMIMFRQHYPQIHSGRGGGASKSSIIGNNREPDIVYCD